MIKKSSKAEAAGAASKLFSSKTLETTLQKYRNHQSQERAINLSKKMYYFQNSANGFRKMHTTIGLRENITTFDIDSFLRKNPFLSKPFFCTLVLFAERTGKLLSRKSQCAFNGRIYVGTLTPQNNSDKHTK